MKTTKWTVTYDQTKYKRKSNFKEVFVGDHTLDDVKKRVRDEHNINPFYLKFEKS